MYLLPDTHLHLQLLGGRVLRGGPQPYRQPLGSALFLLEPREQQRLLLGKHTQSPTHLQVWGMR